MVLLGQQGMQQVPSYYSSEAQMRRSSFPRTFILETYKKSLSKPSSKADIKLLAARKHKEAEKKRRLRINSQYDNLRNILPNLIKKDKASVLAESIKQVKELKENVSKLEENSRGDSLKEVVFPSEVDNLNVEKCNLEKGLVKATLSCENRSGLMSGMTRAVAEAKAKVVKAEMVTVGERTRCVLWMQYPANENLVTLKRTLKVAMHKPTYKMRSFIQ